MYTQTSWALYQVILDWETMKQASPDLHQPSGQHVSWAEVREVREARSRAEIKGRNIVSTQAHISVSVITQVLIHELKR